VEKVQQDATIYNIMMSYYTIIVCRLYGELVGIWKKSVVRVSQHLRFHLDRGKRSKVRSAKTSAVRALSKRKPDVLIYLNFYVNVCC
jgi:hypothetical protein